MEEFPKSDVIHGVTDPVIQNTEVTFRCDMDSVFPAAGGHSDEKFSC